MPALTPMLAAVLAAIALLVPAAATPAGGGTVVVPRGKPVQIVFTADSAQFASLSSAFEDAVRMAIERRPSIHGFPVQLNVVEAPCAGDAASAASAIVANPQNVAVIGHLCSLPSIAALPVYEAAGIVAVSGSATADFLPGLGPTVFDRTVVPDGEPASAAWFAAVDALPSVHEWAVDYRHEFGSDPPELAPFYFDAATIVLRALQRVSESAGDALVVDRQALAAEVRGTTRFQGVTCRVTLDPATGNRVLDLDALARCAADDD